MGQNELLEIFFYLPEGGKSTGQAIVLICNPAFLLYLLNGRIYQPSTGGRCSLWMCMYTRIPTFNNPVTTTTALVMCMVFFSDEDVHKCGRCQREFSTLDAFIQHKLLQSWQAAAGDPWTGGGLQRWYTGGTKKDDLAYCISTFLI